jgi:hypothetical protein
MTNNFTPKLLTKLECLNCHFICSKKCDWERHLRTVKHERLNNPNFNTENTSLGKIYYCICKKGYKHLSSLSNHKKKCLHKTNNQNLDINLDMENIKNDNLENLTHMVVDIVKQNQEFKELILEQNNKMLELMKEKQLVPSIINNNTNNNHFNLNFFLNEKCKDALNIKDFINSIQLQLTDLENTGRLGYVDGISKIFINGLKELDVYKRPVHCSDLKRETLYVKDENQWTKESNKLKTAINEISHKNIKQIPEWIKENPTCQDLTSKKNDEYLHLINNCMVGSTTEEINENYNKIIHNISKEVVIVK